MEVEGKGTAGSDAPSAGREVEDVCLGRLTVCRGRDSETARPSPWATMASCRKILRGQWGPSPRSDLDSGTDEVGAGTPLQPFEKYVSETEPFKA